MKTVKIKIPKNVYGSLFSLSYDKIKKYVIKILKEKYNIDEEYYAIFTNQTYDIKTLNDYTVEAYCKLKSTMEIQELKMYVLQGGNL